MIQLFNVPDYKVDLSKFKNLLYDDIVYEFEEAFAEYVGAKYAVSVSSATDAIFLILKWLKSIDNVDIICRIPTLITTRFLPAITHAGCDYEFSDQDWVGKTYRLYDHVYFSVIDSAQQVNPDQCLNGNINIFSFYPTKPVGGIQGGMICSNNKSCIDWVRKASHFGENFSKNSWDSTTEFKGWQMFMDAPSAYVAYESLKRYPDKRKRLDEIRDKYKETFDRKVLTEDSYHLFRIETTNNDKFLEDMKKEGIICGIHYKPAHLDPIYADKKWKGYPMTRKQFNTAVSIPFHEKLTDKDVDKVIKSCIKHL